MNLDEYAKMRRLEDDYWWFVARRRLALSLLQQHDCQGPILDLGCGTGALMTRLDEFGDVLGLDYSGEALRFSSERGLSGLVQGDAQHLPFADATFSTVVSLDTIEHLADDHQAIREVARVLKPGGKFVMNVPAFQWLWGPHDVALMHYRRYTRPQVIDLLEQAGLQVVKSSYSVFLLFPVVVIRRLAERASRGPAEARLPAVSSIGNKALVRLMDTEAALFRAAGLPWGSSVVAVAKKPDV